jgi:hypothetical protein
LSKLKKEQHIIVHLHVELGGNQSTIELYQTADHPALSLKSGHLPWRVSTAHFLGGFCSTTWKTRHQNPPFDWEVGEGGPTVCVWLGLAHFHNGYSFFYDFSKLT